MHYETLFEVTAKGFEWWPTLAAIAFAVALFTIGRFSRGKANANRRIASYCMAALGLLFAVVIFVLMRSEFQEISRAYCLGNYQVVEGPVENFHPMPATGGTYERFTVRGVPFAYSDYESTPGFNRTSSHGGPLRGGLMVRIAYVHDREHSPERNVILKLEIARPEVSSGGPSN
jgi:hypothetical protein